VWLQSNGSGSFYNLGQGAFPASGAVVVGQGQPVDNSPPTISAFRVGNSIRLQCTAPVGKTVIVETSTAFGPWSNAGSATSSGQPMTFDIPIRGDSRVLFRARH
jgi:hypothetical protein